MSDRTIIRRALYDAAFFPRKTRPSYALWTVILRGATHAYPKLPSAYGRCETLDAAHLAITAFCEAQGLSAMDIRQQPMSWRLVKDLLEGKSGAEFFARKIKRRDPGRVVATEGGSLFADLVFRKGEEVFTNSLIVAERFEKRHKNVLRAIENLPKDKFNGLNFALVEYIDEKGEARPMYEMTWKGFSLLVMGFTGTRAYHWKQSFLDAFEWMGKEIVRLKAQEQDAVWRQVRAEGKPVRLVLTDAVRELVEYAKAQGSQNAERYYQSITRMEYRALFYLESAVPPGFRDTLSAIQSLHLTTAESIAQRAIREGMAAGLSYQAVYALAKERVEQFVGIVGKTYPGRATLIEGAAVPVPIAATVEALPAAVGVG